MGVLVIYPNTMAQEHMLTETTMVLLKKEQLITESQIDLPSVGILIVLNSFVGVPCSHPRPIVGE